MVLTNAELRAFNSFWEYRIYMNPRLTLRDMWFPRSLGWKLRKFWDEMKAGKRPILLIQTPPQHGKSLSVIDFIAWACGHAPELRVIYSSFSDRLGIRANLRLQRALDSKPYRRLFPQTRLNDKPHRHHRRTSSTQSRRARICRTRGLLPQRHGRWIDHW